VGALSMSRLDSESWQSSDTPPKTVPERALGLQAAHPETSCSQRGAENADAIALHGRWQFVVWPPAAEPGVHISWTPIVGCDRIGPAAVAPIHQRQIGTANRAVLSLVEAVTAAGILGCGGGYLHRPLWPVGVGTPHLRVRTVAGLDAVDRKGDPVQRSGTAVVEPDRRFGRTGPVRLRGDAVGGGRKTEDHHQR